MAVRRIVLAALVGGVISFLWSGLSWEVLPWHRAQMSTVRNEAELAKLLGDSVEHDGVVLLPNPPGHQGAERKASLARMLEGPAAFVAVRKGSFDMGTMFAKEIVRQLLAALLLTLLLAQLSLTYWGRVLAALGMALFASLTAHLQGWTHFYFPTAFTALNVLDALVGWFLAALAISRMITTERGARHA